MRAAKTGDVDEGWRIGSRRAFFIARRFALFTFEPVVSASSSEDISWSLGYTSSLPFPSSHPSTRVWPQEARVVNACVKLRLVSISLTRKRSRSDNRLLSNGPSSAIVCVVTGAKFEICFDAIWSA